MKEIKFRNIRKEEIDLRVGATKKEDKKDKKTGLTVLDKSGNPIKEVVGFQLLGYKDARVDATILDETVGVSNWSCKYYQVKNTMICSVGINVNYDEPNREPLWVWKDDAGDESNEEAIKGEASDSFKRGCFRWGVCRTNLYNLPFIWIKVTKDNTPNARYVVANIEFDKEGYPIKLLIINDKTKEQVFSYGLGSSQPTQPQESVMPNAISDDEYMKDLQIIGDYKAKRCIDEQTTKTFNDWLERAIGTTNLANVTREKIHQLAYTLNKKRG